MTLRQLMVAMAALVALPALVQAQDFHHSQFYNAPLHLNPALTGVFGGDVRIMGNYKSQWVDVPVDYQTVTLAVDKQFRRTTDLRGFFSGGLAFNYDRAGDSQLTWANIDLNGSYTRALGKEIFVSVGGKAALVQRSFDTGNLRFDSQFDVGEGRFNPGLPTGENAGNDQIFYPDFSVGINFRFQSEQTDELVYRNNRRTRVDIGVGLHHLTAPDQSFLEEIEAPLDRRLSPYIIGNLQVLPALDIVGAMTYQDQGGFADAFVGMAGARVWLSNKLGSQIGLMAGIGLRGDERQDAYFPTLELSYNNLQVGLNYDFNTSPFDVATENRGGLELSLRYLIRKARPLPEFKVCPLI